MGASIKQHKQKLEKQNQIQPTRKKKPVVIILNRWDSHYLFQIDCDYCYIEHLDISVVYQLLVAGRTGQWSAHNIVVGSVLVNFNLSHE